MPSCYSVDKTTEAYYRQLTGMKEVPTGLKALHDKAKHMCDRVTAGPLPPVAHALIALVHEALDKGESKFEQWRLAKVLQPVMVDWYGQWREGTYHGLGKRKKLRISLRTKSKKGRLMVHEIRYYRVLPMKEYHKKLAVGTVMGDE